MNISAPSDTEITFSLRRIKNIILTIILTGLFFVSQAFAENIKNLAGIKKDIRVISRVIESSTELKGSRAKVKVYGEYLAKQGIVLKIHFPRSTLTRGFFTGYRDFPVPDVFSERDLIEIQAEAAEIARNSIIAPEVPMPIAPIEPEIAFSFSPETSELSKKLREQQRQLRNQQRAMERSVRELEREERNKNDQKLKDKIIKQQKEIKALRTKINEKSKQIQQEALKARTKKQKTHNENVDAWTISLIDNFCSYAPYPRNLPKNEYLSLVISNAVYVDRNLQDKIFVFSNSQLALCRDGKMSGQDLLKKSINYIF